MLPIKIYAMVACPVLDEYCGDDVERYEGPKLTVRSVKLFLDGALGSWGAAMLEPYAGRLGREVELAAQPPVPYNMG
jgi:predicted amidohydrolase YtcJ